MVETQARPQQKPAQLKKPDEHKWAKIIGLILVGFFASRLLSSAPTPTLAPVATPPVAAPAPVVQQAAPVIVQQQPQPIIVQQPQVTILKPQETIIVQKSYPNRTIVIESSPTVMMH